MTPNSAVHVNGKLAERLQNDNVIEPQENIPVLMPRCMYSKDITPRLCLVNASDRYFIIRKGTVTGEAVEAHQVQLAVEKNPLLRSPRFQII